MSVESFNKKKILDYCEKFVRTDYDHLCAAKDNFQSIKEGRYADLEGCPSSFGLDDYEGLCEEKSEEELQSFSYKETCDMCTQCWKKALGVEDVND